MLKKKKEKLIRALLSGVAAQITIVVVIVLPLFTLILFTLINSILKPIRSMSAVNESIENEKVIRSSAGIDELSDSNSALEQFLIENLDDEFYERTGLTPEAMKLLKQYENSTYASEKRQITVTYLEYSYGYIEVEEDEDEENETTSQTGDTIVIDGKTYRYGVTGTQEKERIETLDLRRLTYDYRLPWQIAYALILTVEEEEEISPENIRLIYSVFQPEYKYIHDYYRNYNKKYRYTELRGLPHSGMNDNYSPLPILSEVKTFLYDYKIDVKTTGISEGITHEMGAVRTYLNVNRFMQKMNTLGCDESDVEKFVKLLDQLGGCEVLVDQLSTIFNISL